MTHIYDSRATDLVNRVASEAVKLRNQVIAEGGDRPVDMRLACYWGAQAVAPRASEAEWRGLAGEALVVVQQAFELDRAVVACREMAA